MAIEIVEAKVVKSSAEVSSLSVNFGVEPAAGNKRLVASGTWFLDAANQLTIGTPTGLTTRSDLTGVAGNLGALLRDVTASGSNGVANIASKSGTARYLALVALNISGAGDFDTKGEANSGGSAVSSLTVTTENAVAEDGSLAVAVFFRRSTLEGGSMSYTFSAGFSEVGVAQQLVSPANHCEVYVAQKTVNSGATVSCQLSPAGTATNMCGFIIVYPPSNSLPVVTAPGQKRGFRNVPLLITDFSVVDDGNLAEILVSCPSGKGTFNFVSLHSCSVVAGALDSHTVTISGTQANLLLAVADLVFTPLIEEVVSVTLQATDSAPASDSDVLSVDVYTYQVSGGGQAAMNATLKTGIYRSADGFTGPTELVVKVLDATALSDEKTMAISVSANAAPVNTVPGAQVASAGVLLPISGISVADANLASVKLSTLNPGSQLFLSFDPGVSILAGGPGTSSVTIGGDQTAINNTLATLAYQGSWSLAIPVDQITVESTDSLNAKDIDSIAVTVSPISLVVSLPVESLLPLGATRVAELEAALGIQSLTSVPCESGWLNEVAAALPFENLLPVVPSHALPLEGLTVMVPLSAIALESLSGLWSTSLHHLESLGLSSREESGLIEWLASALGEAPLPLETLVRVAPERTIAYEWSGPWAASLVVPLEFLRRVVPGSPLPLEGNSGLVSGQGLNVESLLPVAQGQTAPLESLQGVVPGFAVPLAIRGEMIILKIVPVETTSTVLNSDSVIHAEAGRSVSGLVAMPLEWLSRALSQGIIPMEARQTTEAQALRIAGAMVGITVREKRVSIMA